MVHVHLPSQLSGLAAGKNRVDVEAATLGDVFCELDLVAPMLRSQLFDGAGKVRQFVGVFVDDRQISGLGDGLLPLREGSQVLIVLAVAGG